MASDFWESQEKCLQGRNLWARATLLLREARGRGWGLLSHCCEPLGRLCALITGKSPHDAGYPAHCGAYAPCHTLHAGLGTTHHKLHMPHDPAVTAMRPGTCKEFKGLYRNVPDGHGLLGQYVLSGFPGESLVMQKPSYLKVGPEEGDIGW